MVFSLRALDPDSVPVNFLIPFEGTPLAKEWNLTPQRCLRILAMVRFVCPDVEVRIAGGREVHLRTMQPLALHLANSIFLGDYLTSEGQAGKADLEMIADAGFEVEGTDQVTLPEHRADGAGGGCGSHDGADAARVRVPRGGGLRVARGRRGVRSPLAAATAAPEPPHGPGRRTPPRRRNGPRAQCLTCRCPS